MDDSTSTVSMAEVQVEHEYVKNMSSEASSYPAEAELELGLGLSLGGGAVKAKPGAWGEFGRILTAKDFPSVVISHAHGSSSSTHSRLSERGRINTVSGTKRAADSVSQELGSANGVSQVVGWPPIRAYRMNSLVSLAKAPIIEEDKVISEHDKLKDTSNKKVYDGGNNNNTNSKEKGHLGFVKVNMDGLPIGRKVDLNAHACYETLAQTLEDMFFRSSPTINSIRSGGEKDQGAKPSKLLDGSSEFVLTYEDKEGDWMLVGDVPWGMFLSTVKRLRIMRTSEVNGLAPRSQERNERPRNKPI